MKIEQRPTKTVTGVMTPTSITVHNTNTIKTSQGRTMAQQYADAQRNGNMKGIIVHYYVDHESIVQCYPLNRQGIHAGSSKGNKTSIAIECIGEDSWDNAIRLIRMLKSGVNNAPLKVVTHKSWSGKNCPMYFLPKWDEFMKALDNDSYFKEKEDAREVLMDFGITDGERGNEFVTREEAWVMLSRMIDKLNLEKK